MSSYTSAKRSADNGRPSTAIRSVTDSRCGLVKRPVRRSKARSRASTMRAVEVLPLVPVIWMTGAAVLRVPQQVHQQPDPVQGRLQPGLRPALGQGRLDGGQPGGGLGVRGRGHGGNPRRAPHLDSAPMSLPPADSSAPAESPARTAAPRLPEKPSLEGVEERWAAAWEAQGTYRFDRTRTREQVYSIDTPPPTVSGSLHVGHVFSYTHTDLIARYQRMRGLEVFYPIGWDDNGLPTERRVQNYYGVRCDPSLPYDPGFEPPAEPGKQQLPISRRNFVELCERLTLEDEQAFEELYRRLGISIDWTHTYQTIDANSRAASQRAFLRNLARGEAYQAEAPTLWDVTFRTAVAQAELEDRERPGAYHQVALPPPGRRRDHHRHHAARAAARLRRAGRPPRRRALPAAVRHHGAHAAVRRRGAGRRPPPRRAGQGHRHRDDLHLRRPHRRDLVARAAAADAGGDRLGRPAGPRRPARPRGRAGPHRVRPAGRLHRPHAPRRPSSRCCARRATSSASRGRSRTR